MFRVVLFLLLISKICLSKSFYVARYKENPAVKRLQEYIQINTSLLENAELAVDFWSRQADELGLDFAVYRPAGLPICVITLQGQRSDLPSIMLNSHFDVVPTDANLWTYPPYSGYIDKNGDMFGRGTQDTKGVGVQYLEALRKLIQNDVTLNRTLHLTVMPDEETGGFRGMVPFVKTSEFESLNIGFALDEGITSSNDIMYVSFQDKRAWQVQFNLRGQSGHGSSIPNSSVVEGLQTLLNLAMEYRSEQTEISYSTDKNDYGAYTTLNINMFEGGIAPNVIPSSISVVMDLRLSVDAEVADVQDMLNSWLDEIDNQCTIGFIRRMEYSPATVSDDSNVYWVAMREALEELGETVVPIVCPATTDMVPIRAKGIPALGFTTKNNMISKIHNINEYIPVDNFLRGIDIYVALLQKLGNLP